MKLNITTTHFNVAENLSFAKILKVLTENAQIILKTDNKNA